MTSHDTAQWLAQWLAQQAQRIQQEVQRIQQEVQRIQQAQRIQMREAAIAALVQAAEAHLRGHYPCPCDLCKAIGDAKDTMRALDAMK